MEDWLNNFATSHAWVGLVVSIIIALHTGLKALRDAIDSTPETDDNWFEKAITILGKIAGYIVGIRPKK